VTVPGIARLVVRLARGQPLPGPDGGPAARVLAVVNPFKSATANLRDRLHKAQDRQNALAKRVRTLEIEAEHATVTATRAEAAERVAALAPQVTALTGQLAEHRAGIPSLDEQHQKAWAANQEAARALTDRDQNINRLNHLIRGVQDRAPLQRP
jgi:chromosome segregation ATPase